MLAKARWGVVLMGAVSGLFVMVVATLLLFLGIGLLGVAEMSDTAQFMVTSFALFFAQLVAGYVAGRLSSADQPAFHGSLGALALYGILAVLSLAAGSPAGSVTLVIFAAVALVIGYAGGVLGGRPRDDDEE